MGGPVRVDNRFIDGRLLDCADGCDVGRSEAEGCSEDVGQPESEGFIDG